MVTWLAYVLIGLGVLMVTNGNHHKGGNQQTVTKKKYNPLDSWLGATKSTIISQLGVPSSEFKEGENTVLVFESTSTQTFSNEKTVIIGNTIKTTPAQTITKRHIMMFWLDAEGKTIKVTSR